MEFQCIAVFCRPQLVILLVGGKDDALLAMNVQICNFCHRHLEITAGESFPGHGCEALGHQGFLVILQGGQSGFGGCIRRAVFNVQLHLLFLPIRQLFDGGEAASLEHTECIVTHMKMAGCAAEDIACGANGIPLAAFRTDEQQPFHMHGSLLAAVGLGIGQLPGIGILLKIPIMAA